MARKILFISHNASRSGAPILLLQFLRWVKANSDLSFSILVCEPGPLLPEFEALAETFVLDRRLNLVERIFRRLLGPTRWMRFRYQRLKKWRRDKNCSFIYTNTIVPVQEMELFAQEGCPVICHVHELDYVVRVTVGHDAFRKAIPFITHFIAGSKSQGKLHNELADLGRIVAVEKLIVALKEQRVRKIIDKTGGVSPG